MSDADLEKITDDPRLADDERDAVLEELGVRDSMRADDRVAEALGAPWIGNR